MVEEKNEGDLVNKNVNRDPANRDLANHIVIQDLGSRVASIETELRGLRDEVQLNRRRYHELSSHMAPLFLEVNDIHRHEMELRDLRSALDRLRGVWTAITVIAGIISALIAALWSIFSRFPIPPHT